MTPKQGVFDRIFGWAFDVIGTRWWLSLPAAALSLAYPVYYFLNWSDQSYSRSGFKAVIALICLGLVFLYATYHSLTSGPPAKDETPGS
jgi:hypothetical protein